MAPWFLTGLELIMALDGQESVYLNDKHGINFLLSSSPSHTSPMFHNDGNKVQFFCASKKGENYKQWCVGWLTPEEVQPYHDTVWKYTSVSSVPGLWYCVTVNLLLASDDPNLKDHALFVRSLKYWIGKKCTKYYGTLYRGLTLTHSEIENIKSFESAPFYIPSFVSTTKVKKKAFSGNVLMEILCWGAGFMFEIPKKETKYSFEQEVLLSCYNVYKFKSCKYDHEDDRTVIQLAILDYHKFHDDFNNTHSLEEFGPVNEGSCTIL